MKAIFRLKVLIILAILLISNVLAGQSLLPAGPLVLDSLDCADEPLNEALTISPIIDTAILNNFTILSYLWQSTTGGQLPNANNSTYAATRTGFYTLTISALRLSDSTQTTFRDTVEVIFEPRCCEMKLPNAFTPNGDNKNDVFAPVRPQNCDFQDFQMQVYNRWGKKIYDSTNGNAEGWDGTIDGKDAPSDVYVYWLRYTARSKQGTPYRPATFKGDVTLIR